MKTNRSMWLMLCIAFVFSISTIFAADVSGDPLPQTTSEFWTFAIAGITPVIVWLVSKIPNLPKAVLPTITPLVGIGLGFALKWLGDANLSWVDMAQAGALSVFVREVFNQWVTKQLNGTAEKTGPKPA